ncbi:winged helix-turn-helix domain-containing protein [Yoonia sp. SS1-5]|uniref:Winged helix-turn-helix domain-containing tetratricopeptide repeat protein n=1 Tax=Yoonia rhodophyticola TaxID=3137370 RepID=A0AAN0MJP2_9RHOB
MRWEFLGFTLDKNRAELVGPDGVVHVERVPLEVLVHLIENADKVISRDDLIDAVWDGRIVSDATISTAVKQARKAVNDTGTDQAVIRTVHGRGFRFVAEFQDATAPATASTPHPQMPLSNTPDTPAMSPGRGRPSLAVLRFVQLGASPGQASLADSFPAELISNLSRIRWLHVIARGSSFRFDPITMEPGLVGQQLGTRYLITGTVEMVGALMTITVEILSTDGGTLVWSDRFAAPLEEVHQTRQEITASIVSALEISIPQYEAAHSRRLSASEFDAWSHFHVGLSHIFKFNQGENRIAAKHFHAALDLDPTFSRAHAGLSFTHWQNAFMQFGEDRNLLVQQAVQDASRALDIDPADPFANFNMGRARWLEGDIDASQNWLDRALQINPNFAQCHYNKGLILALDGASQPAKSFASKAMSLSPLDPLYYGMLGVRAMSHIAEDDFEAASRLAQQAMQSPGAHFYMALIAAAAFELQGDGDRAKRCRDHALHERPDVSQDMFFSAFPFRSNDMRGKFSGALQRLGVS